MSLQIRTAGVIGAGTMGAQIAAHLANCGIPTLLLDRVPPAGEGEPAPQSPQERNAIALKAIQAMPQARLAPLYDNADIALLTAGNIEDDFEKLAEVDWIVEAVFENLEIKQQTFARLDAIHRPGQIISTNTSGISLAKITEKCSDTLKEHVLVTHFFSPPRYMYLLELVKGEKTSPEVFSFMEDFSHRVLGKGVVECKDTPNFIANRIGTFDMANALQLTLEAGFGPEEVDAIVGPVIGRPKTGVFRLSDLVGIDVLGMVNENMYSSATNDESREVFQPSPLLSKMIEKGLLGNKSGAGFYRKAKDEKGKRVIEVLDLESYEYKPTQNPKFDLLAAAKKAGDLGAQIRTVLDSSDRVGKFVWDLMAGSLCYAANRVPEISDEIIGVDNAIRWGFGWKLGSFELWDAIGVGYVVERLEKENKSVPALVKQLLDAGEKSFYRYEGSQRLQFSPLTSKMEPVAPRPRVTVLSDLKKGGKVVKEGKTASIVDLGDGVICLEFHSKANSISADTIQMTDAAVEEAEKNFRALVVGNQGERFSVGADLTEMSGAAMVGNYDLIDEMIDRFQKTTQKLTYARVPVVAAVHHLTLGGGCEFAMHCDRIVAAPELYMGLVETGVGLIPAGGGCCEIAIRAHEWTEGNDSIDLFPLINRWLETVALAKTSRSAADARRLGFLRAGDGIAMNKDALIEEAKAVALTMANQSYRPPNRRRAVRVMGEGGVAEFRVRLNMMRQGGFISTYDEFVANKLAHILCGGNLPKDSLVDEQYLRDLEREAFVALLGEAKTRERIAFTLKTGKPLRN